MSGILEWHRKCVRYTEAELRRRRNRASRSCPPASAARRRRVRGTRLISGALCVRAQEFAVHARDTDQRDALGAGGHAFAGVGAAAEAFVVHRGDHIQYPRLAFGLALWQRVRWAILAEVNSVAEPFGQAATQAPQPMQAAFSKARSASGLRTGVACASGALPVGAVM